jgi:chromate transporter
MSLLDFAAMIFGFNLLTFGDGPIMVALLQSNLVNGMGVLTSAQLLYAFTVARITPGPANIYVAAIGYMLFGLPGAVLATLAIFLPSYLTLPLLSVYERIRHHPMIANFSAGLRAASVGLIFATVLTIGRSSLTEPIGWVVFPFTLFVSTVLKWNPLVSLGVASVLGVCLRIAGL